MPSEESKRIRATLVNDLETLKLPLQTQRQDWEVWAAQAALPPNTTIRTFDADGVACEWVSSPNADHNKMMIYFHGGGFNAGSCKTHRELAARLSATTGVPVLLVNYRLAPEHPFPAAIEDAVTVYRCLVASGTQPQQIILGGDSAGGGIVISALLSLRAANQPMPAAAVLLSPWLDLTLTGESMTTRDKLDPTVSREGLLASVKYYIDGKDPKDPLISPIHGDLKGLPPLLIHVGDHERLLSDSTTLAERAKAAGVEVKLDVWPEMWHVWHSWAAELPEGKQALDQIGEYVRQKLKA